MMAFVSRLIWRTQTTKQKKVKLPLISICARLTHDFVKKKSRTSLARTVILLWSPFNTCRITDNVKVSICMSEGAQVLHASTNVVVLELPHVTKGVWNTSGMWFLKYVRSFKLVMFPIHGCICTLQSMFPLHLDSSKKKKPKRIAMQ